MANGLKGFLRRITGVSTPVGGITLAPPEAGTGPEETRKEMQARFWEAVDRLSAASEPARLAAVVGLEGFLERGHEVFSEQLHRILCANLKTEHPDAVRRMLVAAFEKSLRRRLAQERREADLDFSRCNLAFVNLAELDLTGAVFAVANLYGASLRESELFRAQATSTNIGKTDFRGANLNEAKFDNAHGQRPRFDGACLVSAKFRKVRLEGAVFQRARIQSAHFDGSDIRDARFEGAALDDAFFKGTKFDEPSLRSLARNASWQSAHFDPDVISSLAKLSEESTT